MLERPSTGAPAEVFELVVDIAGYLTATAAAGLIGNRADAVVRRLLGKVRLRWKRRTGDRDASPDASLDAQEAADVARAAALIQGYRLDQLTVLDTEAQGDGSWLVRLSAGRETLRVTVPPGDPGRAYVLIC